MSDRRHRRRGLTLTETVFAGTLALLFTGVYTGELIRQQRELGSAQAVARAASALQEARERLRAGVLAVPPAGGEVAVGVDDDPRPLVRVTARRADAPLDARAAGLGLGLVVLRAEWLDRDGRPLSRELITLADLGGR